MGVAYRDPKLISASAQLTDDIAVPYNVHSVWQVQRISDGALIQTYVNTPVATTDPLNQAAWDAIYATVTTFFNAATGGTTTATNPVTL